MTLHAPFVDESGSDFVRDLLRSFPRPDQLALADLQQWLDSQQPGLDPADLEVVTLHYRSPEPAEAHQGFSDVAVVSQRSALTQAVLDNWQGELATGYLAHFGDWAGLAPLGAVRLVDSLPTLGYAFYNGAQYLVFNGLYRRSEPAHYGPDNHVGIRAEDFQAFVWNLDFHSRYTATLRTYWQNHLEDHRLACKINFITACNRQVVEGSLSEAGRSLAWQAAGLEQRSEHFVASTLNVYGYAATDLLCLQRRDSSLTVLYIPGNSSPLHEFATAKDMQNWFAEQCKDEQKREVLLQHFAMADRPDGLDFSGVATALAGLAAYPRSFDLPADRPGFTNSGYWRPQDYVNYKPAKYSPAINDDLFSALTQRQKHRSQADADFLITSRSDVIKADCRGYLTSAINLLSPLALVVPELAPVFALGGVVQFGLGLDQVINGKTQQQRAAGVELASFGVLNAAPLLLEGVSKAANTFRIKDAHLRTPKWINGRLGYPLSPVDPPRLPEQAFLPEPEPAEGPPTDDMPGGNVAQQEVAPHFRRGQIRVEPLEGADPHTADAISRFCNYQGERDVLIGRMADGYSENLYYDLDRDLFLREEDFEDLIERASNEVDERFRSIDEVNTAIEQHEVDRFVATADGLERLPSRPRVVTQQMRQRSLKAMGIDVPLPMELPAQPPGLLAPIPTQCSCIWVGDAQISAELLDNLAHNAAALKGTPYEFNFRLFLSRADQTAYLRNLESLGRIPSLDVRPLEDQAFYQTFEQSHYHAQYQKALQGGNPASACDILRYRMLHHEGGIYLDIDDTLLANGPSGDVGIGHATLATTPDGLILQSPASNELLDMHLQYNNSAIGSHAGNPTLDAISEEIHARFQQHPDFYSTRPIRANDPLGFDRYSARLNELTGPRVLTEVIEQRLPTLHKLRLLFLLRGLPSFNIERLVDIADYLREVHIHLALDRVVKTGSSQSWIN